MGSGVGEHFNRTTDDLTGGDFGLDADTGDAAIEGSFDGDEEAVGETLVPLARKEVVMESQSVINFMRNVNRIRFNSLSGEQLGMGPFVT